MKKERQSQYKSISNIKNDKYFIALTNFFFNIIKIKLICNIKFNNVINKNIHKNMRFHTEL